MTYTENKRTATSSGGLADLAYEMMPNLAPYEEDENEQSTGDFYIMQKEYTSSQLNDRLSKGNPLAAAYLGKRLTNDLSLNPEFIFRYDILGTEPKEHRLQYQGQVSFSVSANDSHNFTPSALQSDGWNGGNANVASTSQSKSNRFSTRHSLTYTPHFNNEDHHASGCQQAILLLHSQVVCSVVPMVV